MNKKCISIIMILGLFLISNVAFSAPRPFFEGKTIRVIVGLSAGGGYDIWARMIARHYGKNIPGNPTVIVENMTGAGSLIAANHIYKAARPDGLTIGHISGWVLMNQLFADKPGIEFDARKYEYIGAPYQDEMVVFITKASGITTMEKWFNSKFPVKFGGQAPGATFSDNTPRVLAAALGLPVKSVEGYKGTAEIKLACESGEVHGNCLSWESGKVTWRKDLETGNVIPILQVVPKPIPEIPHVPLAISYAKTDEARELLDMGVHKPPVFARPFMLPPGTPKDRVEMLRKAFEATLKDKEFLAELEKAKMTLNPVTGEELKNVIDGLFKIDPAKIAKLNEIVFRKN